MFYTALIHAPAGVVSAWFFLVPVVGVLTAWPLLGEDPSTVLLAGMAGGLGRIVARAGRPAEGAVGTIDVGPMSTEPPRLIAP